MDSRDSQRDIYGYNLSTYTEFQITSDPSAQYDQAIYGDVVVWWDRSTGGNEIFGYRISTGEIFQITDAYHDQMYPAIYGDIVVWSDRRNIDMYTQTSVGYDIYGYDLSTNTEFEIAVDPYYKHHPAIYGDIVVWYGYRNGNSDIFGYDLSTGTEFQITSDPSSQSNPAIYGDIVVWQDGRNGYYDIYGYDLSTGTEFQITSEAYHQMSPDISGSIVVYCERGETDTFDITGYDLATGVKFAVTSDPYYQNDPAINGSTIVWCDQRNAIANIYAAGLDAYGPATLGIAVTPNPTNNSATVHVSATVDDTLTGDSAVAGAELFLGTAGAPGTGIALAALDGAFDSSIEEAFCILDVSALTFGTYQIYVRGADENGNWGDLAMIELEVNSMPMGEAVEFILLNIDDKGISSSLVNKLEGALESLDKGNLTAYANKIDAFINEVEAQSGKKISSELADDLILWATIWLVGT